LRERAFETLAAHAPSMTQAFLFEPGLAAALRRHARRLGASHGYVGHAVGWKRREGRAYPELAITTFVRKKLSKRQLARTERPAAPDGLRSDGRAFVTDVVELVLREKHQASPGASIARRAVPNPGTLGFFARNANNDLVAVTAGHVAYAAGTYVSPSGSSSTVGPLDTSMLTPVDAATVFVQSGTTQQLPTGGTIQGWRPLTNHDINVSAVQLYGAASQMWRTGMVLYLAPWVSGWNIANGVVYDASSLPGDSGGPVLDMQQRLVGLHVGRGTFDGKDVAIANSIIEVVKSLQINPVF
jgi:hypothetical protein